MKQLRIEIDDETDAALDALAASERTPKEAIIRRMLTDSVRLATLHDPLDAIVGSVDAEPVDDIDEVVYGR